MAVSAATGSDLEQQALGSYCRHLVALCIRYQQLKDGVPLGEVQFLACPGTVICIRGFCSFLTAGHALKHWDTIIQQGKVSVRSAVLADIFGTGATSQQPIPFDFSDEPRYYIDDEAEGLDFGLIALRPYHVRLLAKNGIKAVFEENWIHQHRVEFDGYAMLGLPEEFVTSVPNGSVTGSRIGGIVYPTMIGLTRMHPPPEDIRTKYPRFIGRLHPDLPLASIRGMSGGPIFGFNYGPPVTYWIVAIQSSWLPSRKITFGCPLPILAGLLRDWIDELARKGDFKSIVEG